MSKITKSLKSQFRNQLFISIGVLILIFIVMLNLLYLKGRDLSSQALMLVIANYYAQRYAQDPTITLPKSYQFSIYTQSEQLPEQLKEHLNNESLKDRQLSLYRGAKGFRFPPPKALSTIMPVSVPGKNISLYLVFNRQPYPSERPFDQEKITNIPNHPPPTMHNNKSGINSPPIYMALTIAMAVLVIVWLANRLIAWVIRPLEQLTDMAQTLPTYNPIEKHPIVHNDTEIGLLATTLHNSAKIIQDSREREKQFTQNLSHELRTPLAVIGSSLDIIEKRISKGRHEVEDQVQYIRQANNGMRELSEALLWLGRDSSYAAPIADINLYEMCTEICSQLSYLLKSREVVVKVNIISPCDIALPPSLIRIVISNIIRNAFEHTWAGHVTIDIDTSSFTVSDSGEGIGNKQPRQLFERGKGDGFGLGLSIVQQICHRQGWQISNCSNDSGGFTITIALSKP